LLIEENGVATSHRGLPILPRVPGEAETRPPIFLIRVEPGARRGRRRLAERNWIARTIDKRAPNRCVARAHQPTLTRAKDIGVEVHQPITRLHRSSINLIANAVVEGEIRTHPPLVLHEPVERLGGEVAVKASAELGTDAGDRTHIGQPYRLSFSGA